MQRTNENGLFLCSFCHKSQETVGKLIFKASDYPRAYICNECIAVCNAIIEDDQPVATEPPEPSLVMTNLAAFAQFSPEKMAKTTIAQGETLFAGLNCFEPGQQHAPHAHAGQDKLYVVLQGEAEIEVGGEKQIVIPGSGAFAPSGVIHSVHNRTEKRLIILAVLAPPPSK